MRRKHLHILLCLALIGATITACAPQQRLTRLLSAHPELIRRDTTVQRHVGIYLPHIAADTVIRTDTLPCDCDSILRKAIGDRVAVSAGHATATLTHTPHGIQLGVEQQPDTIFTVVEVEVPVVEYIEKERKETPMQAFFRISGIILWALLAILLIANIVKRMLL